MGPNVNRNAIFSRESATSGLAIDLYVVRNKGVTKSADKQYTQGENNNNPNT